MFMLFGAMFTTKPLNKQGGRLPTSIQGCTPPIISSETQSASMINSTWLTSLFSISPLRFIFNGSMITIVLGLIFSLILDRNDKKSIDSQLIVTWKELIPFYSSTPKENNLAEQQSML